MKTTVVNSRYQPYDIYIGRPSKWGNPFHLPGLLETTGRQQWSEFVVSSRKEAIEKYREWILQQPELLAALHELTGKRLGCWCKPLHCHGDVLVELIEKPPVQMKLFGR